MKNLAAGTKILFYRHNRPLVEGIIKWVEDNGNYTVTVETPQSTTPTTLVIVEPCDIEAVA